MPFKNGSNIFALCCLIGTVWTVVATSSIDGRLSGTFHVKSDCVSPTIDTSISIIDSSITSPSGYTFNTLGFPVNTLVIGQDNSGTYNGGMRECKLALQNGQLDYSYLYTCTDNGQFACNIYFGD